MALDIRIAGRYRLGRKIGNRDFNVDMLHTRLGWLGNSRLMSSVAMSRVLFL